MFSEKLSSKDFPQKFTNRTMKREENSFWNSISYRLTFHKRKSCWCCFNKTATKTTHIASRRESSSGGVYELWKIEIVSLPRGGWMNAWIKGKESRKRLGEEFKLGSTMQLCSSSHLSGILFCLLIFHLWILNSNKFLTLEDSTETRFEREIDWKFLIEKFACQISIFSSNKDLIYEQ